MSYADLHDFERGKKVNSRSKGKRGEYGWRDLLIRFGFEARRGQASIGEPDIVHNVPDVHFEVKNTERLELWAAIAQAEKDAKKKRPIVPFKRNGQPWRVVVDGEYYLGLERLNCVVGELIAHLSEGHLTEAELRELISEFLALMSEEV